MQSIRNLGITGLILAATILSGCGSDGDQDASAIRFHGSGGVHEMTHGEDPGARLHHRNNTAVLVLEATGTHTGDTAGEDGVDELLYHFDEPTSLRLRLADFGQTPALVILDRDRREIVRLESGNAAVDVHGEHTLRIEHPRRGDEQAEPLIVFVHPHAAATALAQGDGGGGGVSSTDLVVSGSCENCDLSGLVWDGCTTPKTFEAIVTARYQIDPDNPFIPINPGFQGARFDNSVLRCVRFQPNSSGPFRVNMNSASFTGASLFQVKFIHSDHAAGSYKGAVLRNSVFSQSTAPGADFTNARFESIATTPDGPRGTSCAHFRDLRNARFTGALFDDLTSAYPTLFNGADLTSAQFLGTLFHDTFDNCELPPLIDPFECPLGNDACRTDFGCARHSDGSCVTPTIFGNDNGGATLQDVDLTDIDFGQADLRNTTFRNAAMDQHTNFNGANLFNARFPDSDLSALDLSFTFGVSNADFTGATLSNGARGADLSCRPVGTGHCAFRNFRGFDLRHVKLNGADLMRADMRDTQLAFTEFRDANLSSAIFAGTTIAASTALSGANLEDADFTSSDLSSADLSQAFISESVAAARLSNAAAQVGANLSCNRVAGTGLCDLSGTTVFKGADLRYVHLNNAGLAEADLEAVQLDRAELIGADLNFANLSGASFVAARLGVAPGSGTAAASLRGAFMINVDLTDADLRGADMTQVHAYGANADALFVRTKLDSANLSGAVLSGAIFTNASLNDAVLNQAQLTNARFDGANLTNAKFDNAYLQGANFTTAAAINGMTLSNAAVSTTLISTRCTLAPPGTWTYMEQDGTPYTFTFGATQLLTNNTVICPNNNFGPCSTADSLCPIANGPFPPIPACTPVQHYCWNNCLNPPVFTKIFPSCF